MFGNKQNFDSLPSMQASGNIGHPARFAVACCGHEIPTFTNRVWLEIVMQIAAANCRPAAHRFRPLLSDSI